jgi:hypothetical protein
MKFWISILAVAASGLLVVAAASAGGAKSIAFSATYSGHASTKVDGNTATISASGTGKATLLGAGSITALGTGDASQQPCVPFGGTGTITGSGGTISFKGLSGTSGCGDEGGHSFNVTGHLAIVKATGKLAKAKGTLKITGFYSRDDGTFSIKLSGTLTK